MGFRVLTHFDLEKFREEDSMEFNINIEVFKNLKTITEIVKLDDEIKNRSFNHCVGNNDIQKFSSLLIHSCIFSNYTGFPSSVIFKKGKILTVPLLEDITIKANNVMKRIELTKEFEDLGFTICNSSLFPAKYGLSQINLLYMGDKPFKIENDVNLLKIEFLLFSWGELCSFQDRFF